jgi:hypothetical protein
MNKSIKFLDQIIEKAKLEDLEHKKLMLRKHRSSQAAGDSWMLFHLKELKELILKESNGKK